MYVYLEMPRQQETDRQYVLNYPGISAMKYIDSSFIRNKLTDLRHERHHESSDSPSSSTAESSLLSESKDIRSLMEQCARYNAKVESVVHLKIDNFETRAIVLSKTPFFEKHEKEKWHKLLEMLSNVFQELPDCRFKSELTSLIKSIQSYTYDDVNADILELEGDAGHALSSFTAELTAIVPPTDYNGGAIKQITEQIKHIKNKLKAIKGAKNAIDAWIVQLRGLNIFFKVLPQDEREIIRDLYNQSLSLIQTYDFKLDVKDTRLHQQFQHIAAQVGYHATNSLPNLKSSASSKSNEAKVRELVKANSELREQLEILLVQQVPKETLDSLESTVAENERIIKEKEQLIDNLTGQMASIASTFKESDPHKPTGSTSAALSESGEGPQDLPQNPTEPPTALSETAEGPQVLPQNPTRPQSALSETGEQDLPQQPTRLPSALSKTGEQDLPQIRTKPPPPPPPPPAPPNTNTSRPAPPLGGPSFLDQIKNLQTNDDGVVDLASVDRVSPPIFPKSLAEGQGQSSSTPEPTAAQKAMFAQIEAIARSQKPKNVSDEWGPDFGTINSLGRSFGHICI